MPWRRSDGIDQSGAYGEYVFQGDVAVQHLLPHIQIAGGNLIVHRDSPSEEALAFGDVVGEALPQAEVEAYPCGKSVISVGISVGL